MPVKTKPVTAAHWCAMRRAVSKAARVTFAHGTSDPVGGSRISWSAKLLACIPTASMSSRRRRVSAPQAAHIRELVDARIKTRKPAAYLLNKIYMRGVPFYVDERAIVPRSFLGEILDEHFGDDGLLLAIRGASRACSIFAPAPVALRSSRRAAFPRHASTRSICPAMRSTSPAATSGITNSAAVSACIRATCSRRSATRKYDLIISQSALRRCAGHGRLAARVPLRAGDGVRWRRRRHRDRQAHHR